MAERDEMEFSTDNLAGFAEARRLAPKRVLQALRRELEREGKKVVTEFRREMLFGQPGINLPKRVESFTKTGRSRFRRHRDRDARTVQQAHVLSKAIQGPRGLVLVTYLSRFLGFHADRLAAPFRILVRRMLPRVKPRLEREMARITQAVLDKGLRDANRTPRRRG